MKGLAVIALLFALRPLLAQDPIPLGEKLGPDVMICESYVLMHRLIPEVLSKEDSLSCVIRSTYKTDSSDVFFIQEHDLAGNLREEGKGIAVWDPRKLFGLKLKPTNFHIEKNGPWKFYNINGQRISECGYRNDRLWSGCKCYEFDEKGKMINTSYIDF